MVEKAAKRGNRGSSLVGVGSGGLTVSRSRDVAPLGKNWFNFSSPEFTVAAVAVAFAIAVAAPVAGAVSSLTTVAVAAAEDVALAFTAS